MSDKKRRYSSDSTDDSYEREKRRKSKKYHHKEHRRKHKKEHRREETISSRDRRKYRHEQERDKRRNNHHDREKESDLKYKSKYEHVKHVVPETKKSDPSDRSSSEKPPKSEDIPSTSAANLANSIPPSLPTYYNSSVVNAQKFAEQQKKRKLLWQNKKSEETTKWTNLKFSQDNDGTKANKFMRLMGIKDSKEDNSSQDSKADTSDKSDEMLKTMEHQYEVARNITHISRGVGLGFK